MYEKLGDLLNEALDKGEIPREEPKQTSSNSDQSLNIPENDTPSYVKFSKIPKKKETKSTGSIIRREQLELPPQILQSLKTINLTPPVSWFKIKMQYRRMLKNNHPDTALQLDSTITIDQIKQSFEILKQYYDSHSSSFL